MSDPNFVRGQSFANVFILASRIELFDTSCRTIRKVFRCFGKEYGKYPKKEGEKVIWEFFLTPDSPRLASGSPGPPVCLGVKEPAHLGELPCH